MSGRGHRYATAIAATLVVVASTLAASAPALAASPWWQLSQNTRPSALQPESKAVLALSVANLGDANANGETSPVTITDKLPPGLRPLACPGAQKAGCGVEAFAGESNPTPGNRGPLACPTGKTLPRTLTCTFGSDPEDEPLPPYDQIEIRIAVEVIGEPAPSELENELSVSGAGAPDAQLKRALPLGGAEEFGVEDYELRPEEEGGAPATQAGAHPFQVTGSFTVKQGESRVEPNGEVVVEPVALPKELDGKLPPGLIGNPSPLPQCTLGQFLTITAFLENQCPQRTAVGVAMVTILERAHLGLTTIPVPIYNVEPAVGEPARFGFYLPGTPVLLDPSVRSGSDYGITLGSTNVSQTAALDAFKLIFWGVPGDPRHDSARGIGCIEAARGERNSETVVCNPEENKAPPPFLSLPTSCTGPLHSSILAASWKEPLKLTDFPGQPVPALDGCNRLAFSPSIRVTPDGTAASTPTGLSVDVHVPQDTVLNANGLAESNVKDITVALPAGVAVNPAGGDGLSSCSGDPATLGAGLLDSPGDLIGFTGFAEFAGARTATFTPRLPGSTAALAAGETSPLEPGTNFCANSSKIGTVQITSPLLPKGQPVTGAVYLATQNQNPFGSLIAMYIVAEDPVSGTLVKLPGHVQLCEGPGEVIDGMTCRAAGQLITSFRNTPQLAFEDAELHFFGGERAPLSTPAHCGPYTTEATVTPWSGNEPVTTTSTFNITTGPHGTPCPGAALPFSPSLTAGTTDINAGGFSAFSTTISREDGNQDMQNVVVHAPEGLEGLLTSVKLCDEANANAGTCPPESQIGETTVSAGVGSDPVTVVGGKVFLTEHYGGGQFGLSIVNPVKAGPFDLEHDTSKPATNMPGCDCIVVRAKIQVDPRTAQLTVTAGPIPHFIDGIPVQIKKVNVNVNRPGFTFNPTSCNPETLTGAIESDEGASSPLSIPFQVANCANLAFKPAVSVTTAAKASRPNGQSLSFKIAYPKGAMGSEAWFNEAKFTIPKQLPARLGTIQQACPAETFEHNRSACPAGSKIGTAIVHTPVLPVPLEGPVYFVSHANLAFPDAVLDLSGYGIHVELIGNTLIKNGVTSATFKNTPDVPFESIEVNLPAGKFSEFGSNLPHESLNFCGQKIALPTLFKASNGAEINRNTPVTVTGCSTKLAILSHKAKGRTLTLSLYAPSAGKLKVSGKGLSTVTKNLGAQENLTVTVKAKRKGRFSVKVKLTFTPSKGKRQAKTLKVRI